MSFKLDFNICQSDCDTITFTETTGEYILGVEECCKTGYGYSTNPIKSNVTATRLTFTYPNGTTVYEDVDCGYLPPVYACDSFVITDTPDPNGSIALVASGASIGTAIKITSTEQMVIDLVNAVNASSDIHNYSATWSVDGLDYTVTICDTCGGLNSNGKTVDICAWNLVVDKTELTLSGANGNEAWCFDLTTGKIDGTLVDNCFEDGVYIVTFEIDVTVDQQTTQYSVTKRFLFDCLSNRCLRELILLAAKPNCPCNSKDIHDKIQLHRTNIESANILFDNCEYDCANKLIQETQKFCSNVCLDCE